MAYSPKRPCKIIGDYNESENDAPSFGDYKDRRHPSPVKQDIPVRRLDNEVKRQNGKIEEG